MTKLHLMSINLKAIADKISDAELLKLSSDKPETRFETNSEGHLIIMSPTGSNSGRRNTKLLFQVELWNSKVNCHWKYNFATIGSMILPFQALQCRLLR